MKKMLIALTILIAIPILYVGGNILFAIATKFTPKPVELLEENKNVAKNTNSIFSFLIWNVGYGALGKDVDFFYDNGKMVITPKDLVEKYIEKENETLSTFKDYDFILLQEVDKEGKRSHNINMVEKFQKTLNNHHGVFTPNYDVKFLPFPWTEPLGRIYGGLMSFSKSVPSESKRIALPGISNFPRKYFYLERCLLLQRFPLQSGKELIVINQHLEAYDDGGVKRAQMKVMRQYAEEEFAKGNYVVIGGDWNIAPPDFNVHKWEKETESDPLYLMNNDSVYIPNWQYAYDGETPTNRKNNRPLDNKTFKTVIDYFFVSPNVEITEVKGVNAGFENSDHNPVSLKIKLR